MPSMRKSGFWLLATMILAANQPAFEDSRELIDLAMKEYQAGDYEKAWPLFAQALAEDPSDGPAHYYLGQALKKVGQDGAAVREIELAAKILPAKTISDMAKSIKDAEKKGQRPAIPQLFGMPDLLPAPDDFLASIGSSWDAFTEQFDPKKKEHPFQPSEGAVIPMSTIQAVLTESKRKNPSDWQSEDVKQFLQAPENIPQWDIWISRFRRAFHIILLRHLALEMKDETKGNVGVVFSVDRFANLRGRIFSSTADQTLNKCLIETIEDLNDSAMLRFPPQSHIEGWNFIMSWDFTRLIAIVRQYREHLAHMQVTTTKVQANVADTKVALKKNEELKARQAKLALQKLARAKIAAQTKTVKTEVSGFVLPAKPVELTAKPLKLSDMLLRRPTSPVAPDGLGLTVEAEERILQGESIDLDKVAP